MSEPELDVVGIGFGPSNLAMAIAVTEHNDTRGPDARVRARFLERQATFGWHRGMLLDDATMQVSFLKDLVTLRNPTSEFSFLRYLHSQNRLIDFINHKNLFPLRVEFHDYFAWAAAQVDDQVTYDTEVLSVTPVAAPGGEVVAVDVLSRHGEQLSTHRTRNLVIGTGLRPRLPEGVTASDRVWHTSDLLHNMPELRGTEPRRIVVVGAGQSAAEAVATMHREFPTAEICAVFSRYGYSPADDSSFAMLCSRSLVCQTRSEAITPSGSRGRRPVPMTRLRARWVLSCSPWRDSTSTATTSPPGVATGVTESTSVS